MATNNTPSRVDYNNVSSLGISYTWDHGPLEGKGAIIPCAVGDKDRNQQWIKRTKSIDLELVNVDIQNSATQVGEYFSANQDKYVNTDTTQVYANGIYAGQGRLVSYSINEGSQSNISTTSLGYEMSNEIEDGNGPEDPVSRDESIQVTRDIKGKSYTIQHDYSVSFGDDFDLVSDHPLYADDPDYQSVQGRLQLAENEATEVIDVSPVNYKEYIDGLENYTLAEGFNLAKLQGGCSGAFYSSSNTKDLINGNYSASKTTVIRYTGENMDPVLPDYEVTYTLGWAETEECATVTCAGNVKGLVGSECAVEGKDASYYARSGFERFVGKTGMSDANPSGEGRARVSAFFEAVQELKGTNQLELNNELHNLRSSVCVPSIKKDEVNDGTIEFEFSMDNCPQNEKDDETDCEYTFSESITYDFSTQKLCDESERKITQITIAGSVEGKCGLQLNENGGHPRWAAVNAVYNKKKNNAIDTISGYYDDANPSNTQYEPFWSASTLSTSMSPYQAKGNYSITWSDNDRNQDCTKRGGGDDSEDESCFTLTTKTTEKEAKPRYIDTPTTAGIVTEVKGSDLPRKTVKVELDTRNPTGADGASLCAWTISDALGALKTELNENAPSCLIDTLSWSLQKSADQGGPPKRDGSDCV